MPDKRGWYDCDEKEFINGLGTWGILSEDRTTKHCLELYINVHKHSALKHHKLGVTYAQYLLAKGES